MDGWEKARFDLARRFRETADHSSEQELRNALSRSYDSLYHAARVWVGRTDGRLGHRELRKEVEKKDRDLAKTLRELYRFRENADYDPQMVNRNYNGDLESFRLSVSKALDKARKAYLRLESEVGAGSGEQ